ncbi:hypothetical protein, partial [Psychromonas aquimarina]|uniref:hypothetical protein n=1 Tax=Psychromonas aquimarina TaxID=444919 RepID=UPI000490C90C
MSLEQAIGELVKSNDAMAQSMEKKAGEINNALSQQELKVADYLAGARLEAPFYRLTKNQYGNLADGLLEHYSINNAFPITFEVHRTITSGVNWALRDAEEQEILTAMGLGGGQSFIPSIPIIKMSWSGYTGVFPGNHTFYQLVPGSVSSTTAC